ncbi:hypothetical protein KM043_015542 [Ampulex compressa]|nr:hypothetical protein KM043_015542 [Ampulex compressa]
MGVSVLIPLDVHILETIERNEFHWYLLLRAQTRVLRGRQAGGLLQIIRVDSSLTGKSPFPSFGPDERTRVQDSQKSRRRAVIDVSQPYEARPNRPRRDADEERRYSTSNPERSYNTPPPVEVENQETRGWEWKEPEEDFGLVLVRRGPPGRAPREELD